MMHMRWMRGSHTQHTCLVREAWGKLGIFLKFKGNYFMIFGGEKSKKILVEVFILKLLKEKIRRK